MDCKPHPSLMTRLPTGHLAKPQFSFACWPFAQGLSSVRQAAAPATRHSRRGAFTLIELMVVISVIAVLAALTLSIVGHVNKKGAESRARAEVAALSAAIESFKLATGAYPTNTASLYSNLCPPIGKVFFEPRPQMLRTNAGAVVFVDPWDQDYQYANYTNYFELWSTGGGDNPNSYIRN